MVGTHYDLEGLSKLKINDFVVFKNEGKEESHQNW